MRHALLLLLLVGCGGIAFEDYDNEADSAYCDFLVRCHAVATASDCHAFYDRFAIESPSLAAAIEAGSVQYDEDAAQGCIDAYDSLSCDLTRQPLGALAACDEVYEGALVDGAACGFDLECKSGSCARESCPDACCPGTCRPEKPLPGIDEACESFCVDGAYCGFDSICHAWLPKGAACQASTICEFGLYCAGASMGGSGVCKALPYDGEPCEGPCAEYASHCLAGVCQPAGVAGDACNAEAYCTAFYSCNSDQRCGSLPGVGMECNGSCSGGAYCDGTVCLEQKPSGASCMLNVECATHFCGNDDVCGDPPLCI